MNRRLLLFVTSPALLIGLFLIVACSVSMLAIQSMQNRLVRRINAQVASLRAVHDMEVALRQLRFHFLTYLLKPDQERWQAIEIDHEKFELALAQAKKIALPNPNPLLQTIEKNYYAYRSSLNETAGVSRQLAEKNPVAWIDDHPIRQVVEPCQELLEENQILVENAFEESAESGRTVRFTLVLLGVVGPVGGLLAGIAITRALSRSIARLQVRVQDVHSQLAPEVGVVDLNIGQGLEGMDLQLQTILSRVQALVERMQAHQEEAFRAKQLAEVGQLAGSIAHEIRNPLTAMRWLVDAAVKSYPEEPLRIQDLEVLQSEIERMDHSVQQVLDFVRLAPPRRVREDIRHVVRESMSLTRARRHQLGVRCELDLPDEPVWVQLDASQIKSMLVNLALNAMEAMPHGGTLTVRLSKIGANAELVVEDTGSGIPAAVLERIFQPFVTTKHTGTGLGLNVSHRIVEEHKGTIVAENKAEGGARFRIVLPLDPASEPLERGGEVAGLPAETVRH